MELSPPRPYAGWTLPQRIIGRHGAFRHRLSYARLPGDMVFYDGDDDGMVDHVDTYIGNGYALDSSTSAAGSP